MFVYNTKKTYNLVIQTYTNFQRKWKNQGYILVPEKKCKGRYRFSKSCTFFSFFDKNI